MHIPQEQPWALPSLLFCLAVQNTGKATLALHMGRGLTAKCFFLLLSAILWDH